jgi:hypothetical protein
MGNIGRRLELSLSRSSARNFAIAGSFADVRLGDGMQQDTPGTVVDRIAMTGTILCAPWKRHQRPSAVAG